MKIPLFKLAGLVTAAAALIAFLYVLSAVALWGLALRSYSRADWRSVSRYTDLTLRLTGWARDQDSSPVYQPFFLINSSSRLMSAGALLYVQGHQFIKDCLQNRTADSAHTWSLMTTQVHEVLSVAPTLVPHVTRFANSRLLSFLKKDDELKKVLAYLELILQEQALIEKSLSAFPGLIGMEGESTKTYTVILQNDREIRPTGGFAGSFAQLTFQAGGLAELKVEDIYVPDGALPGHVDPPAPIQAAFQQGKWQLANSNWDPDFVKAAQTMEWFFVRGGVDTGQGMIALNLQVVEDMLKQLPPIYLPNLNTHITADNFYEITQYEVEKDFFPGSTAKRDHLKQLVKGMEIQAQGLEAEQLLDIAGIVLEHARQRNIQFYFHDPDIQQAVKDLQWSGEWRWPQTGIVDFVSVNDANMGANKANCCVTKEAVQNVSSNGEMYETKLMVTYTNNNKESRPDPPRSWGGDYRNYVRVYVPISATVKEVLIDDTPVQEDMVSIEPVADSGLLSIGFFVLVPHNQQRTVTVRYQQTSGNAGEPYSLFIQKQSGIRYRHTVYWQENGQSFQSKRDIDQDAVVRFDR